MAPVSAFWPLLLIGALIAGSPAHSAAQQAAELRPAIATLTAGVESLDKVRALYGRGADTTVQDIHSLYYYVEQIRGCLSVASFEHQDPIRSITITAFAGVAPGCQGARIAGSHLTAAGGIGSGDLMPKVTVVLGAPASHGNARTGNRDLFYSDYRVAGGQWSRWFQNGNLVLTAVEAPPGQAPDAAQADIISPAERAAVRAVNFRQGDAAGFFASRGGFTEAGWRDFVRRMQGFLDERGAPTFTSAFVASGNAHVLDEKNGILRFSIPGTLTQTNNLGRTTYRGALEVTAGGTPVKIQKLEQITCVGASTACGG